MPQAKTDFAAPLARARGTGSRQTTVLKRATAGSRLRFIFAFLCGMIVDCETQFTCFYVCLRVFALVDFSLFCIMMFLHDDVSSSLPQLTRPLAPSILMTERFRKSPSRWRCQSRNINPSLAQSDSFSLGQFCLQCEPGASI